MIFNYCVNYVLNLCDNLAICPILTFTYCYMSVSPALIKIQKG